MASSTPPARRASAPKRLAEPAPRRRRSRRGPPPWLLAVLSVCLFLVVAALLTRSFGPSKQPGPVAAAAGSPEAFPTPPVAAPTPTTAPTPTPVPTAEPTPEPTPSPEPSSAAAPTAPPVQNNTAAQEETGQTSVEPVVPADSGSWFSDAVFIGDSRVAGFRLYSGVTTEATFLDHTGLTIYEVKEGKKVIRRGDQKVSVLDALASGTYGKVYIALGVNELGYFNPEGFAQTCGEVVESIRALLPDARVYIQSLIPVNTEKCKANDIPYYITNEGVVSYNTALENYFADKDVYLLGIPDGLVDENGEVIKEYSADGVHFKKDGYVLWLNYLTAHTEG